MKLRIRGDSLRLRLSQSDVASLAAAGRVEDAIHFGLDPAQRLACVLEVAGSGVDAELVAGTIRVRLSPTQFAALRDTDEVGVTGQRTLGDGRVLAVVIEKDFKCLVPRAESEDADGFARPDGAPSSC